MKIKDLLSYEAIDVQASASSKEEIINKAIDLMVKSGKITDRQAYAKKVFEREEESTTGVGMGIAIPHGRDAAVAKAGLAAMVIPDGVEYVSLDAQPVHLLFLIAAPEGGQVHLEVLAKLSRMLMDETLNHNLQNAKSADEFLQILTDAENALEGPAEEETQTSKDAPLILAVTSCPNGIAHTYMAAENIEKKAKELGYRVKVETRGSGGAKNVLIAEEIKEADGVIVAADAKVPTDRFDGKRLVQAPVSDGIHKPEELIARSLDPSTPVFKGNGGAVQDSGAAKESGWRSIYTSLMNGVSHMLPFVIGGGLMIAIAFLIDGFAVDMNTLAEADRALFGTINPVAAFFKNVGGLAFGLMLPVLAGFIAEAIADRPGLAPGFIGVLIAANGNPDSLEPCSLVSLPDI